MLKVHSFTIAYPENAGLEQTAEKLAARIEHYHIPKNVRTRTGIRHTAEVEYRTPAAREEAARTAAYLWNLGKVLTGQPLE